MLNFLKKTPIWFHFSFLYLLSFSIIILIVMLMTTPSLLFLKIAFGVIVFIFCCIGFGVSLYEYIINARNGEFTQDQAMINQMKETAAIEREKREHQKKIEKNERMNAYKKVLDK